MSLAAILALGFVLGMRHATDADHVVAVSTIVNRERSLRASAPMGLAWGVGHTATILLVGSLMVFFGLAITPRIGLGLELTVAVMLVVLGGFSLRNILRDTRAPAHDHASPARAGRPGARLVRPLVVGIVHGLAGSAAVTLLVLGTVREATSAFAYLLVFGLGTMAGMSLITVALAAPLVLTKGRFQRVNRFIGFASSVMSMGLGLYVGYEIAFVHGIFGGAPQWTPQ